MREAPADEAKVVSQALFGERIQIQQESLGWALIQTPDEYTGWVKTGSFTIGDRSFRPDLEVSRLQAHLYSRPEIEFGPMLTLPFGAVLERVGSINSRWEEVVLPDGRNAFIQKGDVEVEPFDWIRLSEKFLGVPYLWGGRSSFGFDCSGFVQMLYSRQGIRLPRDARQQIMRGVPVPIEKLEIGDLIFWGKSEEEIGHVGMFLGEETFIHASSRENKPYVRMSRLSDSEWAGGKDAFYPFRAAMFLLDL